MVKDVWFFFSLIRCGWVFNFFFFNVEYRYGRARVMQLKHSPLFIVAWVQNPALTPYVGRVFYWFSPLLQEVFSPATSVPALAWPKFGENRLCKSKDA